ncbi:hypothetical protein SAMN05444126_1037 [Salisediminibacterium halotolerans]|uniref:Uncharacterized protein n=1 Tax=Salisediminibacterium halotolerans TaxID=517425 RepID=A0A1H9QH84_9BACI|nr:hypothetical protein SAMN05444126_1037 [Salisediminibacterium haloalkalitolerans]
MNHSYTASLVSVLLIIFHIFLNLIHSVIKNSKILIYVELIEQESSLDCHIENQLAFSLFEFFSFDE